MTTWKTLPCDERISVSDTGMVNIGGKLRKQTLSSNGYLTVRVDGRNILVQWLVAEAFLGPRPDGYDVCHFDAIRINNCVENLYYASRSQNLMDKWNQRGISHGSSKFLGVSFSKRENKWKAYYDGGQKRKYLGTFDQEVDAAKAVNKHLLENGRVLNPC